MRAEIPQHGEVADDRVLSTYRGYLADVDFPADAFTCLPPPGWRSAEAGTSLEQPLRPTAELLSDLAFCLDETAIFAFE